MLKGLVGAAFGAGAILAAASAGASVLLAEYSDTAGFTASWEQDSNPIPIAYADGLGTIVTIWDFTGSLPGSGPPYIIYYNVTNGGGLDDVSGSQLYSGPESAPVFAPGSFPDLLNGADGGTAEVTYSVVPELPTWAWCSSASAHWQHITDCAAARSWRKL